MTENFQILRHFYVVDVLEAVLADDTCFLFKYYI